MNHDRTPRGLIQFFAVAATTLIAFDLGSAHAATLRPRVVVHEDTVRLRDIFNGSGIHGDTVLFRAPPPGQSIVLPGKWLRQVARSYKLDWRPGPGTDESQVKRSSNRLGAEQLVAVLTTALEAKLGLKKRYEITLDNPAQEVHLPVQFPATVAVKNLFFNARSNRYSATLMAPDDRPDAISLQVAGRVHELVAVAVPRRRFRAGEIIRKKDLDIQFLRTGQLHRNAITSHEQIVGKSARRSLLIGKPLTEGDVREPQLVSRGSMVIMTYRTANMVVTTHGTARENGTAGETVRVRNTNSGKVVEAVVTGQDSVTVMSLTPSGVR